MSLMKAVQVGSPRADFELVNKEIPEPKGNEIRIRVEACGVCHGDALVKEGNFPGIQYPRVPGHEVVGIVDKLGTNAAIDFQVGQRVGVGWYGGPCLKCNACKRGDLGRCENILATGISFDGGYAEYMVAPMQAFVRVPDEISTREAAPLLCAGRTTYDALRNSGARGGDLVAVLGMGGLGHLALQFARKFGCKTVALSRGKDKEELAYQLGAHVYVDTETANPGDELRKLGGARSHFGYRPQRQSDFRRNRWAGQRGSALPPRHAERTHSSFSISIGTRRTFHTRIHGKINWQYDRRHTEFQRALRRPSHDRSAFFGTGLPRV